MKPTKNRVYCRDCGRVKMLFETEKQADTFIRFNREEIEERAGYCPARSYFCIICNGWHVTSKKEHGHLISKSEKILGDYKTMKLHPAFTIFVTARKEIFVTDILNEAFSLSLL